MSFFSRTFCYLSFYILFLEHSYSRLFYYFAFPFLDIQKYSKNTCTHFPFNFRVYLIFSSCKNIILARHFLPILKFYTFLNSFFIYFFMSFHFRVYSIFSLVRISSSRGISLPILRSLWQLLGVEIMQHPTIGVF